MKVVIAGSRDITDYSLLIKAISLSNIEITEVVSGKARGVDDMGETWARANNIPIKEFPADWNNYGKRAGPIRNAKMGEYADAAIILWDGQSTGTRHMIEVMNRLKKPAYIQMINIPKERLKTLEDFLE